MALDGDELNKRREAREIARKKRKRAQWLMRIRLILAAIVLIGCGVGIYYMVGNGNVPAISVEATLPEVEVTEAPTELPRPEGIDLGSGLVITEIGPYSGPYLEDGTDEQVSDVLMIVVYNYGTAPIQYAEISLAAGDETASFTMSTLPVGEQMLVLEKERMAFDENVEYTQAAASNVAQFQQPLSLCQDKIQIQSLDGAMNIVNISGQDITGEVIVYYKNIADGMLQGGITYRVRFAEGMKKDEVRQIMTNHYSSSGSRVMFVTCG